MQDKKLKYYLKISFWAHIVLFAIAMLSQIVFPGKANLLTPTVHIDMVALPNQVKDANPEPIDTSLPVKNQAPPAEKKSDPEPEKKKSEEISIPKPRADHSVEKRAKSAVERLREQMKKEREEIERKKQELLSRRKDDLKKFEQKYREAIRGNQTNQGSSMTGEMQATMNAYAGAIMERLRANWALPVWLQSKGLRASVRIYIDGRGNLVRFQFSENSGNDTFDEYVKGTIQRSNPFAPPPEDMVRGLRNSGIEVSFPL